MVGCKRVRFIQKVFGRLRTPANPTAQQFADLIENSLRWQPHGIHSIYATAMYNN
jgi:hypothetical protein